MEAQAQPAYTFGIGPSYLVFRLRTAGFYQHQTYRANRAKVFTAARGGGGRVVKPIPTAEEVHTWEME